MTLTARIISGILAYVMMFSPIGWKKGDNTEAGGVKEITVAQSGGDFKTIEEARDYIRTLNKSKYDGINVTVKSGVYQITEAIEFTEEDTGTEKCPITYKGEDGAEIVGGAFLYAKDFTKSEGGLTKYFPEEARDKIVMADMTKFGLAAETVAKRMDKNKILRYLANVAFLSKNGTRQTIAQYPDDWMHIGETVTHSADGTTDTAIDFVTLQTIDYGEEHFDRVTSWSEAVPVYVMARLFKLWCPDDSVVVEINKEKPTVDILFAGGHQPYPGAIMYFYNVPEELDRPGEYIYDANGILYYYPDEDFGTAEFTVPLTNGIVKISGADYITFDNLIFSTTLGNGMTINGDNITVRNCEICNVGELGVKADGDAFTLDSCSVHHTTEDAIKIVSGDIATLTGGGARVYNCDIYSFGLSRSYGYAVTASGVDITVSHNDVHEGDFKGIHFANAVNAVAEYNDVYRLLLLCDDVGALSIDGRQNANIVFRYNYIHEIGSVGEAAKIRDYNPDYEYYGADAFYHDGGASYCEMYGNVINGCDDGYRSNGGRNNKFHNNLICDCRMWYCLFVEREEIDSFLDEGQNAATKFDEYIYSDAWKEVNPDLAGLRTTTEGAERFDPTIWCAPANLESYDNFIMYNKADRYFTRWGVKPYNIEKYILNFNPDTIEPAEMHLEQYSSKRDPLDIEKAVADTSSVTGITLDVFHSIGRVSD